MNEKKRGLITLCVVVGLIALLIVLSLVTKDTTKKEEGNTTVDDSELTSLNFVDYDTFMSKLESGEKAIYVLGQTTCGYCSMYKPVINEVASEYGVEFNYININTLEEDQYNSLKDAIDYVRDNDDWGTPLTLIVEDGETVDKINGYTEKDEVVSFLKTNGFIEE
ncbi:MAG: thioredoxin family protein [Bacilli bacterium]|nr:thioredoxin family protein [Bacilli bacterium]